MTHALIRSLPAAAAPARAARHLAWAPALVILAVGAQAQELIAPEIDVDPNALVSTLEQGQMETQGLTIANLGDETLEWEVSEAVLELRRIGALGLDGGEQDLRSAVIDPAGDFAYFGTDTSPGRVVKIDLETFERVDAVMLENGEDWLYSAVIDPAGDFAYFGTFTFPGRVVKIDLETFERVDAITLAFGEDGLYSAVIDPAGDFAYFGTYTSPGRVVKIDLETFERVDAITLGSSEFSLLSAVIDPAGDFAYFGTNNSPARVVKIDLETFERVNAIGLARGESILQSAVIDPAGDFAYFGTRSSGRVVKIDLETFERVDAITLAFGETSLESAVIDPAGEFAYFGTVTFPSRVVKIDLETFARVDAITLATDEYFLLSAVIDPAGEFAYFGTFTIPGRVVKIDLRGVDCTPPAWLSVDPASGSVPGGGDQLADVTFDASGQELGDYEAILCLASNDPARALTTVPAALNVTEVTAPWLAFDPASLDFGDVTVGTASAPLSATLENAGDAEVTVIAFIPTNPGFEADTSACGEILPAGASCDVLVTFAPFVPGPASGILLVLTVEGASAELGLEGNGVEPELVFTPSSHDFGDIEVGSTSPPRTATLVNTGDAEATGIAFTPPGNGFEADTSACGETLPAGASCDVLVTFAPTVTGAATGSLIVESAEGATAELDLSGNGVDETEVFVPMALAADPEPLMSLSDGNLVFEPGERVEVAPTWVNGGEFPQFLAGTASGFTGPEEPTYDLAVDTADYGEVEPEAGASCLASGMCYQMDIGPSGVARPALHWDAAFDETLTDETAKTWTLHVGDSFVDVQRASAFYRSIETLLHHGVSTDPGLARRTLTVVGCTESEFCPAAPNTRAQAAVFLLQGLDGAGSAPADCVEGEERFDDVPAMSPFCPWVEELARRGVTAGCGTGLYCPSDAITRGQMAVFLLKALAGADHEPPDCGGTFDDVPCPSPFAAWIEELAARGITSGCGADPPAYCPAAAVTRAQMAVFVTRTFGLTLYGP